MRVVVGAAAEDGAAAQGGGWAVGVDGRCLWGSVRMGHLKHYTHLMMRGC